MAFTTLILQAHNIFHVVEIILSTISVGLLAPEIQDDKNIEIIFYTLIAWTFVDVVVLIVYYDAVKMLHKMDELERGRHYILRAVIAAIIGIVYICEACFLIQISTSIEGSVLGLQLAAGLVVFVAGIFHILECLASRHSAKNINVMDMAYVPTCDSCCWNKTKPKPQPT